VGQFIYLFDIYYILLFVTINIFITTLVWRIEQ
jgi:hypothetical protein